MWWNNPPISTMPFLSGGMSKCELVSSTNSCPLNRSVQQWLIRLFIPDHCQMRIESIPEVSRERQEYSLDSSLVTHTCHSHTHTPRGNLECLVKQVKSPCSHWRTYKSIQKRPSLAPIPNIRVTALTSGPAYQFIMGLSGGTPQQLLVSVILWNGIVTY